MTRTTPPRPHAVLAAFPELAAHSATATRLHPRPGNPTVHDSSVGGPLLWPAGEPWPHCDEDTHYAYDPKRPEQVRRWRQLLDTAWRRTRRGERLQLSEAEQLELDGLDTTEPDESIEQPIAMLPVLQLYRRDVPGWLGPDTADLLQVLWCPLDHDDLGYCPRLELRWRRAADVGAVTTTPPEPAVLSEQYLPEPCVLHPEQVREYQYSGLLPKELAVRVRAWEQEPAAPPRRYQYDLSIAPGWKLGGFASWHLTDPYPMDCTVCDEPMCLLLRIHGTEWDGGSGSWRPVEEDEQPGEFHSLEGPNSPTGITIGRGYGLWVFHCPTSFDHPHRTAMQ
ncbi:hypothetical protein [Catellatospora sp. NPDC049133]|uniref:hypothetical protein n=1 Tax=Catellatospora sp. NPDC049133 TaxID=3155499 RepID=UPI0033EEBA80